MTRLSAQTAASAPAESGSAPHVPGSLLSASSGAVMDAQALSPSFRYAALRDPPLPHAAAAARYARAHAAGEDGTAAAAVAHHRPRTPSDEAALCMANSAEEAASGAAPTQLNAAVQAATGSEVFEMASVQGSQSCSSARLTRGAAAMPLAGASADAPSGKPSAGAQAELPSGRSSPVPAALPVPAAQRGTDAAGEGTASVAAAGRHADGASGARNAQPPFVGQRSGAGMKAAGSFSDALRCLLPHCRDPAAKRACRGSCGRRSHGAPGPHHSQCRQRCAPSAMQQRASRS
jgi:hypothetical protein